MLEREKAKLQEFLKKNSARTVGECRDEIRELVNECVSAAWKASAEKMRRDLLRELG